jgi:hypothetical protein
VIWLQEETVFIDKRPSGQANLLGGDPPEGDILAREQLGLHATL